jgi:long-chain acyl-CoA synthetase
MFSSKSPSQLNIKVMLDDIASILYTSGTTGKPKGVILTHKNFYANFNSLAQTNILRPKDNILSILPLHHAFPFMVTLIAPLFSKILITYSASLKSEEILSCMRQAKVTILVGVPQLFDMFYKNILAEIKKIPFLLRVPLWGSVELTWLLRKISNINLSKLLLIKIHQTFGKSLRLFVSGGAKLDDNATKFLNKIGFTILEGYGLTETAPAVTFNPYKKPKTGSVGQAIPDVKIKIIDGEVVISGPNVMAGYYKLKQETQAVLKDGWLYSGDLGYLDKDGYLYLTGRKKELIVLSSGKNIAPYEIETYYGQSSYIKELCVLMIKDKLMAIIVPDIDYFRKKGEVNIYGMIKWDLENFSKKCPAYKRIMGFVISKNDLPRTRLGKLKRYAIQDKYKNELLGIGRIAEEVSLSAKDLQLLASKTSKEICKILAHESQVKKEINLTDHLEIDLGFDSLARIELITKLEKFFKINISDKIMAQIFTVQELITTIKKLQKTGKGKTPQIFSWQELLTTDPSSDIIAKINLYPNFLTIFYRIVLYAILYCLVKTFWRLKGIGQENLPLDKTFILCVNHNSYLDGFAIAVAMPAALRKKIFFLGMRALFEIPIIKTLAKLLKIIPIDPGVQLIDAMQASAYILRNKKLICIFPEAARSINGEVKAFKKGIGILAKELNIELVPIYIQGSFAAWPRTQRFPKFKPITVIFGKPYKPNPKDDYETIAAKIREKVIHTNPV